MCENRNGKQMGEIKKRTEAGRGKREIKQEIVIQ
jgi:hypothetical protein